MARTKKATQPDTSFDHGANDPAVAAAEQPAAPEAASHTNGHEHTTPHGHQEQHRPEGHTRKEYPKSPDPYGIAGDYVAGVRLLESRRFREMQLKFEEKPAQPVIEKLREAGYRWQGQEKAWTLKMQHETAMTDRIDAERLFKEVTGMIRDAKGAGQAR